MYWTYIQVSPSAEEMIQHSLHIENNKVMLLQLGGVQLSGRTCYLGRVDQIKCWKFPCAAHSCVVVEIACTNKYSDNT